MWLILLVLAFLLVVCLNRVVAWVNVDFLMVVAQILLNSLLIHYYVLIAAYGMFRSIFDALQVVFATLRRKMVGYRNFD